MISDDHLTGWLIFFRLQLDVDDARAFMPTSVQEGLCAKGWLEITSDEPDWQGDHSGHITDAGVAVCDLNGPEWGVESLPEPSETKDYQ